MSRLDKFTIGVGLRGSILAVLITKCFIDPWDTGLLQLCILLGSVFVWSKHDSNIRKDRWRNYGCMKQFYFKVFSKTVILFRDVVVFNRYSIFQWLYHFVFCIFKCRLWHVIDFSRSVYWLGDVRYFLSGILNLHLYFTLDSTWDFLPTTSQFYLILQITFGFLIDLIGFSVFKPFV